MNLLNTLSRVVRFLNAEELVVCTSLTKALQNEWLSHSSFVAESIAVLQTRFPIWALLWTDYSTDMELKQKGLYLSRLLNVFRAVNQSWSRGSTKHDYEKKHWGVQHCLVENMLLTQSLERAASARHGAVVRDVMNVVTHWARRGFIFTSDSLYLFRLFAQGDLCASASIYTVCATEKVELIKKNGLVEFWNAGSIVLQCDIDTAVESLKTVHEDTLTARTQWLEQERVSLPSVDKWFEEEWSVVSPADRRFWEELFRWHWGVLLLIELYDILSYESTGELKVAPLNEEATDYMIVRNSNYIYFEQQPVFAGDCIWGPPLDILWKGYRRLVKKYTIFKSARSLT